MISVVAIINFTSVNFHMYIELLNQTVTPVDDTVMVISSKIGFTSKFVNFEINVAPSIDLNYQLAHLNYQQQSVTRLFLMSTIGHN